MKRIWQRIVSRLRARRRVMTYDDLTTLGATAESRTTAIQSPVGFGEGARGAGMSGGTGF